MKNRTKILLTLSPIMLVLSNATFAATSMFVDAAGNVGVGIETPTSDLTVKRSGADVLIEDTNATAAIRTLMELKNTGPVGFKLSDTTSSGEWAFRTGGGGSFIAAKSDISGPVFSFGGDGSVSMGQNPGSAGTASNMTLSPVGNLTITGSFMTPLNTYADYVFASDYKLMPLDELQTFIKTKKHLPNVLSEAEVKKTNMINVSELQITQLAKIEELTLYTLQQHQQIRKLSDKTVILQSKFDEKTAMLQSKLDQQEVSIKAENVILKERLASLEKLVTNLAMGSGTLSNAGKIALK